MPANLLPLQIIQLASLYIVPFAIHAPLEEALFLQVWEPLHSTNAITHAQAQLKGIIHTYERKETHTPTQGEK